jgi:hypothetical protein
MARKRLWASGPSSYTSVCRSLGRNFLKPNPQARRRTQVAEPSILILHPASRADRIQDVPVLVAIQDEYRVGIHAIAVCSIGTVVASQNGPELCEVLFHAWSTCDYLEISLLVITLRSRSTKSRSGGASTKNPSAIESSGTSTRVALKGVPIMSDFRRAAWGRAGPHDANNTNNICVKPKL